MHAKTIGGSIRELRIKRGLTQARLAELAGMSGGNVSLIETGTTNPGRETLERIAAALSAELVLSLVAEDQEDEQFIARVRALWPHLPPVARTTLKALLDVWEVEVSKKSH